MDKKTCQSCGMPMDTQELFATEENGSKNEEYCIYCYENGQFKQPDITMEGMIDVCVPFMKEHGMSEEQARTILNQQLPSLKRWKI